MSKESDYRIDIFAKPEALKNILLAYWREKEGINFGMKTIGAAMSRYFLFPEFLRFQIEFAGLPIDVFIFDKLIRDAKKEDPEAKIYMVGSMEETCSFLGFSTKENQMYSEFFMLNRFLRDVNDLVNVSKMGFSEKELEAVTSSDWHEKNKEILVEVKTDEETKRFYSEEWEDWKNKTHSIIKDDSEYVPFVKEQGDTDGW